MTDDATGENGPAMPDDEAAIAFARAYARWLQARADLENPDKDGDEEFVRRLSAAEAQAERELFVTPSGAPGEILQKLEAFESVLAKEICDGPRADFVLMLALAAIKQDAINLNLFS